MIKLAAYFSQATIFKAMQLLFAGQLRRSDHSTWQLTGEFGTKDQHCLQENALGGMPIYAHLDWTAGPIVGSEHSYCSCDQGAFCEHLAALAIDHIAKKNLIIAYSGDKKRADTAHRLLKTEFHQRFDPYPTMVRNRIVYLLSFGEQGLHLTAHKGYLSKNGNHLIKKEIGFGFSTKSSKPKYVTQADLFLFEQIKALSLGLDDIQQMAQQDAISLEIVDLNLIKTLCETQRCFWQDCERAPIKVEIHYPNDFIDVDAFISIGEYGYLDLASMSLILQPLAAAVDKPLLDLELDWRPQLRVSRHQIEFPWHDEPIEEFEVVNFFLVQNELSVNLDEVFSSAYDIPEMMKQTAELNVQLAHFPLLTSTFESPVWETFATGTRVLPQELSEQVIGLHRLSLAGWEIKYEPKNRFEVIDAQHWYGHVSHHDSDKSWFDLEIGVEINGKKVNLLPYLVNAVRQGLVDNIDTQTTVLMEIDSGERLALPAVRIKKILAVLVELYEKNPLSVTEMVTLPMHQLTRIAELSSLKTSDKFEWLGSRLLKNKAEKVFNYLDKYGAKTHVVQPPIGLKAELRSYQQQGINWLQFLKKHGFSGILADDMGLGKTIQTLASILTDKECGQLNKPCLIVAPTSLLANWLHEAQTFTPDLNILEWSGGQRHKRADRIHQVDVIITSYGTLQQDALFWTGTQFHLVVLDEAQNIKNACSRIAKVVGSLTSTHKLCLTGTPLENHLGELWSLFNFLMPGFLGNLTQFNRLYQTPIEKEDDETKRHALVQRISPFLLRRMKSDVATELPTKTVINEYISLTQVQADFYETIRLTMSDELRKAVSLSSMKRNRLALSNALLKLRQVCCHPELLKLTLIIDKAIDGQPIQVLSPCEMSIGNGDERQQSSNKLIRSDGTTNSGKLNWLAANLPSMIEDGRRVLIFSSFTSMLTLISDLLDTLSIDHVELTGKSRDRSSLVKRFQDHEVPVFLISLKAGGSGLNLTAADVVIHTDPWWNPAAEQQASDRAYRIGQNKSVFVYKLICKDTVEERIQRLQESKFNLAQSIYDHESQGITDMTGDDWLALLKPLAIDK